jgi:hypothetical protein
MSPQRREIQSIYIEWAKLRSVTRYNLASSGVLAYPLAELDVRIEDLAIEGPDGYGYSPLIKRLAAKSGVPEECVVHTQGTSLANHLVMASLIEADDEILIEEPAYEAIIATALYLGARIRRFPRRLEAGFQLDPREIERAISPRTRLIVLTNLHNPTGVRTPEDELKLVGEIARSVGAHVLVDEVYLESCFDVPWQPAFRLGHNFVSTGSLTKAYGLGGLRCGWVLAAPPLAKRIWRINDLFGVNAPHPTDMLSAIALEKLPQIAARAKKLLDTNRALLKSFLDSRRDLITIWPKAGPIAFPQLADGHADAFCQLLSEKFETSVVPGQFFESPEHFRMGVGGKTEDLSEGLSRVGAALDEIAARR